MASLSAAGGGDEHGAAASFDEGAEVDTAGLLEEDDDTLGGPRTWGDWFLALHPMARW